MSQRSGDPCDAEEVLSSDELMARRAEEYAADCITEEQREAESRDLLEHVAPTPVQTCGLCAKPITDPADATVFQRALRAPSIIAHGACFAQDLVSTFRISSRGGKAAQALGLDR